MHIRYSALFLSALLLSTDVYPYSACRLPEIREVSVPNRWKGKKVAFLGDSITEDTCRNDEKLLAVSFGNVGVGTVRLRY